MNKYTALIQSNVSKLSHFLTFKDIVIVFLLNTFSAALNALHYYLTSDAPDLEVYRGVIEYIKVFNLLGFSLMFSYLLLSPGPDGKIYLGRVLLIGFLAFVISFPISLVMFDWDDDSIHPFILASTYLLGNLLLAAWAIFVVIYIKRRESIHHIDQLHYQIEKRTEERDKAELELHLLQAQLEPHFFFNTLANLHNLIDIDPQIAKKLLEELTEYLRSTIPQFRKKYITLGEEIESINRYINIQKLRYKQRLNFEANCDKDLMRTLVLPMSVLSLVENAIKHGVEKSNQDGRIILNVHNIDNDYFEICVQDSLDKLAHYTEGTGVSNLKSRLQKAYGNRAKFELYSENGYTSAKLEVPKHD